jgi:4-amino-4-deoxy-L-arabinose transferase-like glycosyltransferase
MAMMNLLLHFLAMLLLAGILWLPGFAIERLAFRNVKRLMFRNVMRLCLGTAFWISSIFLLCAVHCFNLPAIAMLVLLAIVGSLPFVRLPLAAFQGKWQPSGVAAAVGCALPIVASLTVLAICSMDPVLEWDTNVYHLQIPKFYIANQGFVKMSFNVYSNWPLNGELLFGLAMLLKDYVLANSVQCLFFAATAYAVFEYVRARRSHWFGLLAVVFMLFNPMLLWELTTAYVDVFYAFFLTAAFLFATQALDAPDCRKIYLTLSGVACGLMVGFKITGFAGAGTIAVYYLAASAVRKQFRRGFLDFGLCMIPPVVLGGLPWMLKAVWYTGNPVYPFLYGVFGGPEWSENCSRQFVNWQSSIGMGRSPVDFILLPVRVILWGDSGYAHFDGSISRLWIVLLPLSLIAAFWNRAVRACLVVAGVYFAYWAFSSQQIRFLIPILPILAIAAAGAIGDLIDRLITNRAGRATALAIVYCAFSVLLIRETIPYYKKSCQIAGLYGGKDRQAVLDSAVPAEFAFIDRALPSNAKLLMLNHNWTFYCRRDYIADSFFEASQIADWLGPCSSPEEIVLRLKDKKVTHILFWTKNWHIAYPTALQMLLNDPSLVTLLAQTRDNNLFVFALK